MKDRYKKIMDIDYLICKEPNVILMTGALSSDSYMERNILQLKFQNNNIEGILNEFTLIVEELNDKDEVLDSHEQIYKNSNVKYQEFFGENIAIVINNISIKKFNLYIKEITINQKKIEFKKALFVKSQEHEKEVMEEKKRIQEEKEKNLKISEQLKQQHEKSKRKNILICIIVLIIIFSICSVPNCIEKYKENLYIEANKQFEDGNYGKALELYEKSEFEFDEKNYYNNKLKQCEDYMNFNEAQQLYYNKKYLDAIKKMSKVSYYFRTQFKSTDSKYLIKNTLENLSLNERLATNIDDQEMQEFSKKWSEAFPSSYYKTIQKHSNGEWYFIYDSSASSYRSYTHIESIGEHSMNDGKFVFWLDEGILITTNKESGYIN